MTDQEQAVLDTARARIVDLEARLAPFEAAEKERAERERWAARTPRVSQTLPGVMRVADNGDGFLRVFCPGCGASNVILGELMTAIEFRPMFVHEHEDCPVRKQANLLIAQRVGLA